MDNTKPIPEPLRTNVSDFADSIKIPEENKCLFMDGAQYMYNLREIYVDDLKGVIEDQKLNIKFLNQIEMRYLRMKNIVDEPFKTTI